MRRFFKDAGFEHVVLKSADGALEAAPAMGAADIILDLVSTGVTLRENNLKEVQGGDIMHVRSLSSPEYQWYAMMMGWCLGSRDSSEM